MGSRKLSLLFGSLALNLFLVMTGAAPEANKTYPPPGRLVDVGGWRLRLNCTGRSNGKTATVVLEAGSGDFSVDWSLAQPEIARFARVCSYDRAGSAWKSSSTRFDKRLTRFDEAQNWRIDN
jgi:hypothetical protein